MESARVGERHTPLLRFVLGLNFAGRGAVPSLNANTRRNPMKKLISAVAIAAVGIVSLAASPARADERGHRDDYREDAPWSEPARPMPVPRAAPRRYYQRHRWEAEQARERRLLEERRAEFYAYRHNRWQRARFERWYADRCHELDRGLRIGIDFPW